MMMVDPTGDGLNLFAYCCNDPVNNVDPSGYYSWKKLKEDAKAVLFGIGNAVVEVGNALAYLGETLLTSITFEFECGIGLGASVNLSDAVEVEALAVVNRDALEVNRGEFNDYREMEYSAGVTFFDTATIGISAEYQVDLSEVHESNRFYTNENGKWDKSWNTGIGDLGFGEDVVFSLGARGYLFFGFGIELGINLTNLKERIENFG